MKYSDLKEVLTLGGVEIVHKNQNGWLVCRCPFAKHLHEKGTDNNPSCFVKIAPNGYSGYNCYSCHSKGRLSSMFEKIAYLEGDKAITKRMRKVAAFCEGKEVPDRFDEYESDEYEEDVELVERPLAIVEMFPLPTESKRCVSFLKGRGIDPDFAESLGLRYDVEERRLVFPIKDYAGRLFGFAGRDVTGKSDKKVKNYYGVKTDRLLLGEDRIKKGKPVILQEGVMGYLSLLQNNAESYANVVASFGSYLSKTQRDILVSHGLPVIILYDLDLAGELGVYGKIVNGVKVLEGAYDQLKKHLPTAVALYPDGVDDVDDLVEDDIRQIVEEANYLSD